MEIADETQPHEVVVWNADDAAREITVQIHKDRSESDTTTVLDATYEVPADQALEIQLVKPATYTIDVTVPATDNQTDIRIPQTGFDCNGVTHRVALRSDGSIDVSTISTMVACTIETATDT